jgi:hypothetical protein
MDQQFRLFYRLARQAYKYDKLELRSALACVVTARALKAQVSCEHAFCKRSGYNIATVEQTRRLRRINATCKVPDFLMRSTSLKQSALAQQPVSGGSEALEHCICRVTSDTSTANLCCDCQIAQRQVDEDNEVDTKREAKISVAVMTVASP